MFRGLHSTSGTVVDQLLSLKNEGLTMSDGMHVKVDIKLGGDMQMLNAMWAMCGCSSLYPCI